MSTKRQTLAIQEESTHDEAAAALSADLARLRDLIANAPIAEARDFVKELEQRWPDSDRVKHFTHVLALPVVRRVPADGLRPKPRDAEFAWLRNHAGEYPGCWLALLEDRLLAADPNLGVVVERIRAIPGTEQALLHFQPVPRAPR